MSKGTARPSGSSGEGISHFNAVRMRIVGTGDLKMTMYSLDDVNSKILVPYTLTATTNREPTRLTNFIEQRASLKGYTTELGEYFKINRIIIFSKELWSSYPG